jgi:hypothetical protein
MTKKIDTEVILGDLKILLNWFEKNDVRYHEGGGFSDPFGPNGKYGGFHCYRKESSTYDISEETFEQYYFKNAAVVVKSLLSRYKKMNKEEKCSNTFSILNQVKDRLSGLIGRFHILRRLKTKKS